MQEELREQLELLKSSGGFAKAQPDGSAGNAEVRAQMEDLRRSNMEFRNRVNDLVRTNERLKKQKGQSDPMSLKDLNESMTRDYARLNMLSPCLPLTLSRGLEAAGLGPQKTSSGGRRSQRSCACTPVDRYDHGRGLNLTNQPDELHILSVTDLRRSRGKGLQWQ